MVFLWLGLAAWAGNGEDPIHVPEANEPPGRDAALELLTELGDAGASVDVDWLREHVRPVHLSVDPSEAWMARLAQALGPDGRLGAALRQSEGPLTVTDGPDYTRVVLSGPPLLSVVVRRLGDHEVVDEIAVTSCGLCDEPTRFARDLIADVQRNGVSTHRLLPGVELFVEEHMNRTARAGHWLAVLQARNVKGKELERLFEDATVVRGGRGEQPNEGAVDVVYGDGQEDHWTIRYEDSRWQLDYGALPDESPLRMAWADMRQWREDHRVQGAALDRWTPSLDPVQDGVGRVLGDRVIGARIHPMDGTILAVVADLDRTLAGLVRIDMDTGAVLDRTPIPPPKGRTQIDIGTWFGRWHVATSPDGDEVAIALPGRVWHIDRTTGERQLLSSAGQVTALSVLEVEDENATTVVIGRPGRLQVYRPSGLVYVDVTGTPVEVALHQHQLVVVHAEGEVEEFPLDGGEHRHVNICCPSGVTDAALHPTGRDVLASCATECRVAAQRLSRVGDPVREPAGAGADRPGVSYSPDGRWFTTPAQGEQSASLLIWDAGRDVPVARFGDGKAIHDVDWSPDGRALLTVDEAGTLVAWDLARIRQQGGI